MLNISIARKSIVAERNIKNGTFLRGEINILPMEWDNIIGKQLEAIFVTEDLI